MIAQHHIKKIKQFSLQHFPLRFLFVDVILSVQHTECYTGSDFMCCVSQLYEYQCPYYANFRHQAHSYMS